MKRVLLYDLPDEIMLVVAHPSGVEYRNQVGGNVCWQAELEGVLAPLDVSREVQEAIEACPFPNGRQGITHEIADTIDARLAAGPQTSCVRVDRARLDESWEAWVHVIIDSPQSGEINALGSYLGPIFGFGAARGVLTWPNSD